MPFTIVRQSIIETDADAIVNTANPLPCIGDGTDRAVYEAAGTEELLAARSAIGPIAEGDAKATPAFRLPYKIIIHTVSPRWKDGTKGETALLSSCYRTSMDLAAENGCRRIAFPLLASGSNGFPKDVALKTALDTIQDYLMTHELDVILAVFDKESFQLSERVYSDVRSYIEEHEVIAANEKEYRKHGRPSGFDLSLPFHHNRIEERECYEESACSVAATPFEGVILPQREDTFQIALLRMIDESGESDPAVYKRANVDRKLFAKIRKDENYKPSRKTAIAFAVALKLPLSETQDLLGRAGYALSSSTRFDLIIRYCLDHRIYDIGEINSILFEFDQELL